MLGPLNNVTIPMLYEIRDGIKYTQDYSDYLDALNSLYIEKWIDGYSDDNDDCVWILTVEGRKLLSILDDIII
jgi:hypothetical protein